MTKRLSNLLFISFILVLIFSTVHTVSAQSIGFTLTPNQAAVSAGDTLEITINMNTGGQKVNSFISQLSYPQEKLTFVSINPETSPFTMALEASGENGTVKIIRGTPNAQSGELFIAKVTFKAVAETSAKEVLLSNESAIISSNNENILPESTVTNNSNNEPNESQPMETSNPAQPNFFTNIIDSILNFFTSIFK